MENNDTASKPQCVLCNRTNEHLVWQCAQLRVILAPEPDYPGFTRVIWNDHVSEMSHLAVADRSLLMRAVLATEAALIETIQPDKINLASLGNYVPHLHWHVIPRFRDDPTWPDAVWAPARRTSSQAHQLDLESFCSAVAERLARYVDD